MAAARAGWHVLFVLFLSPCVPQCHGVRKHIKGMNESAASVDGLALVASDRRPVGTETSINVDRTAAEINAKGLNPVKLGKAAVKIWFALFRSGNITVEAVALAAFNTFGVA